MWSKFFGFGRQGSHSQRRSIPIRKTRRPERCRPEVEALEARYALSCSVGIVGGQLQANCDAAGNEVTLDHAGSTTVLNGVPFADASFSSILINSGRGGSQINLFGTVRPVTVTGHGGQDWVLVSSSLEAYNSFNGSVQGILAPVTITNPQGYTHLSVDNGGDATPHNVTISATAIVGLAPAPINFPRPQDLHPIFINGGKPNGTNTFTILDTPEDTPLTGSSAQTVLYTNYHGGSPATVNVQRTTGSIAVDTWAAGSTVNVGNAGSVQSIRGRLALGNVSAVNLDDSADLTSRSVALSWDASIHEEHITGLAPAEILANPYNPYVLLTLSGGHGGNSYTVFDTGEWNTTLNTGTGRDFVSVRATTGPLSIIGGGGGGQDSILVGNAGSVQGIRGAVSITNRPSYTALVIDDSADSTSRRVSLSDSSVAGLAPALINFQANDLASLLIEGGNGGNIYTVTNTPNNLRTVATTLNTGLGIDDVSVLATTGPLTVFATAGGRLGSVLVGNGSVQGIRGTLTVNSPTRLLDVDNYLSRTASNVMISDHSIVGLAPAAINFRPQGLAALQIEGGNANGTFSFNVSNTGAGVLTTLETGPDRNVVHVQGTTGALTVLLGGPGSVSVGSLTTLDALHGALTVVGSPDPGGPVMLGVDDGGSRTSQTYTVTRNTVARAGAALITYNGLTDLWLFGGQGGPGNRIDIESTQTGTATLIFAGSDNSTINVSPVAHNLTNIAGALTVNGPGNTGTLNVNDQGTSAAKSYTVTAGSVTRTGGPTISYATVASLVLNGGSGGNRINVQSTLAGTSTTVNAGAGNDTINIGNGPNRLDDIQGPLTVNGQAGTDTLNVNDQGTTTAKTYTVTGMNVTRTGGPTISYFTVANLLLNGGSGGNAINVQGTAAGTAVTINAGTGNNAIGVGANLHLIQGLLTIHGQGGADVLTVNDQPSAPGGLTYTVSAAAINRTGMAAPIAFDRIARLEVYAAANGPPPSIQGNVISVDNAATGAPVFLDTGGSFNFGGHLTKTGTGLLTLVGDRSAQRTTVINGGTVLANATQANNNVTVNSGAVLSGTGRVGDVTVNAGGTVRPGMSPGILHTGVVTFTSGSALQMELNGTTPGSGYDQLSASGPGRVGDVTVNAGGTVRPGMSPGILHTGVVTFTSGSALQMELNGTTPGSGYDQLSASGPVNLNGARLNAALGFASAVGDTFTIVTASSVSGTFAGLDNNAVFLIGGVRFRINYTAASVVLTRLGGVASQFRVSAPTGSTAGDPFAITVIALDAASSIDTTYRGTVHFTSSDGNPALPGDYTFTAADNGVHTFSGVVLRTAGNQTVTATDVSAGTLTGRASVMVSPAPANSLSLSGLPASVTAGVASTVTVTLRDSFGNLATGYRGTVSFSPSDSQGSVPDNYTFTAVDAGLHTFLNGVTLRTAGSRMVTASGTGIAGSSTENTTVIPAATSKLVVTGFPSTLTAGTPGSVTVTASDAYGNATPSYTGTVHFTSSDPQAGLPMAYTFMAADMGVHIFTNGVTLKTAGVQSITVSDGTLSATANTTVIPATPDHLSVVASVASTVAGTPFDMTVTVQDRFNNTVTTYTGTVTFASGDPFGATLPADYSFTAADAGTHTFPGGAILYTVGTWDVTASDASSGITGSANVFVTPAAADHFSLSAPASAASGVAFDVTVIAQDPYGNTDTNYQGAVTFSTSDTDSGVVLPAGYTFTPDDGGSHTFRDTGLGETTLITVGDQTITATDTVSGISGAATVTVQSSGAPGTGEFGAKGKARGAVDGPIRSPAQATAPAPGRLADKDQGLAPMQSLGITDSQNLGRGRGHRPAVRWHPGRLSLEEAIDQLFAGF